MKKIFQFILSRAVITVVLILFQVGFFMFELSEIGIYYAKISAALRLLSIIVVFYIIYRPMNPSVKIAWIVPIMIFPLFGGIMYLMFGHTIIPKKLRKNIEKVSEISNRSIYQNKNIINELDDIDINIANQCRYINKYAQAPVWKNSKVEYLKIGEEYWKSLLQALNKAEKFIFLEYFIIAKGEMWDSIHEILKRKVKEGVEVRVIYDDIGCVFTLPKKYNEKLEKEGIRCIAFNKIIPFLAIILDNRDHKKVAVIDGKTAFTGGINIADEYINSKIKYGHWKDNGIKVEGNAVWNFTVMFLQMWNMSHFTDDDYLRYKYEFKDGMYNDGYVQPYSDSPLDNEALGESIYLNIINSAKKYIYVYTPYLVVDNEMVTALILAAKRGVDVRIVTPGIPDKKIIYQLTQSYYWVLLKAGVRILQYTPGFIHAKSILCDDDIAVVGSINFDYRSLYHHFECGTYMYKTSAGIKLKEDMEDVFNMCEEITKEWCTRKRVKFRILGPVLKLISPLL